MRLWTIGDATLTYGLAVLILALATPALADSPSSITAGESTPAAAVSDQAQEEAAVRFLEQLQRSLYQALGRQPPRYDENFVDGFVEEFLNSPAAAELSPEQRAEVGKDFKARILRQKLRSKYEDPASWIIIDRLNTRILEVLASSSATVQGTLTFGSLPTRRVNARTFPVPGTDRVVIAIEDQLFLFALLFSKAVVYAFPGSYDPSGNARFSTDKGQIKARVESDPALMTRFQEVLTAYLVTGAPGSAPRYFQVPPHSVLARVLLESLELFVLGHEYGHVLAKHVQDGRQAKAAIGDSNVTEIVRSWQEEFEADVYGLVLCTAAMQRSKFDLSMSYWGADFFFTMLDIVEKARHLLATGRDMESEDIMLGSHPPPFLRRQALRSALKQLRKDNEGPLDLAEVLQYAADLLWDKTKPLYLEAYRAGRRPHPSWQR